MKKVLIFLLAVVWLTSIFSLPARAEIEKVFDKVTNSTVIRTKVNNNPARVYLFLWWMSTLHNKRNITWLQFIKPSGKGWKFECHSNVHFRVDNDDKVIADLPFDLVGKFHYEHYDRGSIMYVEEFIKTNLTLADIGRLSKAKKIDVRICGIEWTLPQSELNDLKTFISLIKKEK